MASSHNLLRTHLGVAAARVVLISRMAPPPEREGTLPLGLALLDVLTSRPNEVPVRTSNSALRTASFYQSLNATLKGLRETCFEFPLRVKADSPELDGPDQAITKAFSAAFRMARIPGELESRLTGLFQLYLFLRGSGVKCTSNSELKSQLFSLIQSVPGLLPEEIILKALQKVSGSPSSKCLYSILALGGNPALRDSVIDLLDSEPRAVKASVLVEIGEGLYRNIAATSDSGLLHSVSRVRMKLTEIGALNYLEDPGS